MSFTDEIAPAKDGFISTLRDRWDHPIAGPFIFAWVIWNHNFLLVLFSSGYYKFKVAYLFKIWPWQELAQASIGALLSAALYIVLAPFSDGAVRLASALGDRFKNWVLIKVSPGELYDQKRWDEREREFTYLGAKARQEHEQAQDTNRLLRETAEHNANMAVESKQIVKKEAEKATINHLNFHINMWLKNPPKRAIRLPNALPQFGSDLGSHLALHGLSEMQVVALKKYAASAAFEQNSAVNDVFTPPEENLSSEEFAELYYWELISIVWLQETSLQFKVTDKGRSVLSEFEKIPAALTAIEAARSIGIIQ